MLFLGTAVCPVPEGILHTLMGQEDACVCPWASQVLGGVCCPQPSPSHPWRMSMSSSSAPSPPLPGKPAENLPAGGWMGARFRPFKKLFVMFLGSGLITPPMGQPSSPSPLAAALERVAKEP